MKKPQVLDSELHSIKYVCRIIFSHEENVTAQLKISSKITVENKGRFKT